MKFSAEIFVVAILAAGTCALPTSRPGGGATDVQVRRRTVTATLDDRGVNLAHRDANVEVRELLIRSTLSDIDVALVLQADAAQSRGSQLWPQPIAHMQGDLNHRPAPSKLQVANDAHADLDAIAISRGRAITSPRVPVPTRRHTA